MSWTSVIGSAVNGLSSLWSIPWSNTLERKNATQAYERNLSNWMMQNDYNSPSEQMKRLKEAGLNPNLIYGSVNNSAGAVSSAPVARAPNVPSFDLMTAYQNLEQQDATTQQIKAQTSLVKQQETNAKLKYTIDELLSGLDYSTGLLRNRLTDVALKVAQASLPSDIEGAQHKNDWSYRWSRNVGEWMNALSPFVSSGAQAGASHFSWHRGE